MAGLETIDSQALNTAAALIMHISSTDGPVKMPSTELNLR
jgi:hypothetical protein